MWSRTRWCFQPEAAVRRYLHWPAAEHPVAVNEPMLALAVAAELPFSANVQAFCYAQEHAHWVLRDTASSFTAIVVLSFSGNC